jgi:transcriptional regulator with XRE-family HTH domain
MSQKRKQQISEYIARHIKQYREEAGVTQAELGSVLGKSNSNISDIERGRLEISASELGIIAEALKRPVSYFYPFRAVRLRSDDELRATEDRMITAMRLIPYMALEEQIVEFVEGIAEWANKDEFQRMAQELIKAGRIILEKD